MLSGAKRINEKGGYMKKEKVIKESDLDAETRRLNLLTANKIWNSFWKPICEKEDSTLDLEQIKLELADYHHLIETVPKVYCEITGGLLSKTSYTAETILSVYNDNVDQLVQDAIEDYKDDHDIEEDDDGEIISVHGTAIK